MFIKVAQSVLSRNVCFFIFSGTLIRYVKILHIINNFLQIVT